MLAQTLGSFQTKNWERERETHTQSEQPEEREGGAVRAEDNKYL